MIKILLGLKREDETETWLFTHDKMKHNFYFAIDSMHYRWVFVFRDLVQSGEKCANYFLLLDYVFTSKYTGNDSAIKWGLIENAAPSKTEHLLQTWLIIMYHKMMKSNRETRLTIAMFFISVNRALGSKFQILCIHPKLEAKEALSLLELRRGCTEASWASLQEVCVNHSVLTDYVKTHYPS